MKRILSALIFSLPAIATDEADFSKLDPGTYSDVPYIRHEAQDDTVLPAAYVKQRLEVLRGVHDTLSAKAAVAILRTLSPKAVAQEPPEPTPINVLQMGMAEELNRLRDAHFYGAAALAEYLNFRAEDALIPLPATPELRQQLTKEILANTEHRPGLNVVSGGPGFGKDSAWIVHVTDKQECYDTAFSAASEGLDSWEDSAQRMEVDGERRYIVYTITLLRHKQRYKVEQWCDITAARKVYTQEEQQQAMQHIVSNLRQMQQLMVGIADKESADAAVPQMVKLIRAIPALREIAETQNTETSLMNNLSPEFDYTAFRAAIKRHQEQNCYGSEALLAFLRSLVGNMK